MGCWNKTCGLTNLHIFSDTPVYVFLLEQNLHHDRCYSTAFWKPALLPFEAVYNEVGGGDDCDSYILRYILPELKQKIIEMEVGENPHHDIAVTRADFNIEQFFETVGKGRLKVKRMDGKESEIDFVMMRKEEVDNVLAQRKFKQFLGINEQTREGIYDHYTYADVLEDIPEYVARLKTLDKPLYLSQLPNPEDKDWSLYRLASILRFDSYRFSSAISVNSIILEQLKKGNWTCVEGLLNVYVKGLMIDSFLDSIRKLWSPGCHEGSQAQDHDGYEVLLNVMQQALAKEIEEQDEDWED
jgi:hypothetical protein